jgi:hypothetical protein
MLNGNEFPRATVAEVGEMEIVGGGGAGFTVICADPDIFVYPACVEFAMQLPVPTPDGVNTPEEVIVPPVALQVMPVLNAPVP